MNLLLLSLLLAPAPDPKHPNWTVPELALYLQNRPITPWSKTARVVPTKQWPAGEERWPEAQGYFLLLAEPQPNDLHDLLAGRVSIPDLHNLTRWNMVVFVVRCRDEETARKLCAADPARRAAWGRFFFAGSIKPLQRLQQHLPRASSR